MNYFEGLYSEDSESNIDITTPYSIDLPNNQAIGLNETLLTQKNRSSTMNFLHYELLIQKDALCFKWTLGFNLILWTIEFILLLIWAKNGPYSYIWIYNVAALIINIAALVNAGKMVSFGSYNLFMCYAMLSLISFILNSIMVLIAFLVFDSDVALCMECSGLASNVMLVFLWYEKREVGTLLKEKDQLTNANTKKKVKNLDIMPKFVNFSFRKTLEKEKRSTMASEMIGSTF